MDITPDIGRPMPKGRCWPGIFRPTPGASSLTRAPHANQASTPVTVRFSDSAGIPTVPDNDPQGAVPSGFAIRFHLGEHVHTDIVAHSVDGFPVRTPEDFLAFLQAVHASGPNAPKPSPVEVFLGSHPTALAFVTAPKPIPASFATQAFFAVNAFRFIAADGSSRFGRYRVRPVAGPAHLTVGEAAAEGPNFLFEELTARLAKGPIAFTVAVQVAADGDVVDDATSHWPAERPEVDFGTFELTALAAADDPEKTRIIFDPIPRVDGIEPSADPLLEARANVYLLSGRRRRAAQAEAK